jgi:hypothetical protein
MGGMRKMRGKGERVRGKGQESNINVIYYAFTLYPNGTKKR